MSNDNLPAGCTRLPGDDDPEDWSEAQAAAIRSLIAAASGIVFRQAAKSASRSASVRSTADLRAASTAA